MAKLKLTKAAIERISPALDDVVVWDEALPGFGVRVKPSGSRTYIVQYRNRHTGASRRLTLGQHGPLLTFDQAKKHARALLADAMRGADPVEVRRTARCAPDVADLARDYLERHATPQKRPRSVRGDEAMLRTIIVPAFGAKKVSAVTRRDLEALHLRLKDRPYQANRVLALLSKMFALAVQWGWRADNPVRGIPRFPEEKRERWLSDDELQRLCEVLENHPNRKAANAVRLQLLTGARVGEVLTAQRSEFDLSRGVWVKPSHHTKQKRREHLPLSSPAQELVRAVLADSGSADAFLFPGNAPGKPLQDIKRFWASVLRAAGLNDYRLHDNRHTYASHLVSSGLSLEIVGRLLGHTNPITTKRYAHIADDPLRAAAERFGSKLQRHV
jgi:integrase